MRTTIACLVCAALLLVGVAGYINAALHAPVPEPTVERFAPHTY